MNEAKFLHYFSGRKDEADSILFGRDSGGTRIIITTKLKHIIPTAAMAVERFLLGFT